MAHFGTRPIPEGSLIINPNILRPDKKGKYKKINLETSWGNSWYTCKGVLVEFKEEEIPIQWEDGTIEVVKLKITNQTLRIPEMFSDYYAHSTLVKFYSLVHTKWVDIEKVLVSLS